MLSSTFTLRALFGSRVAGDSQMGAFPRGGPGNLGLVGLTGVVSHGLTGVEDAAAADGDDAALGSGGVVLSTRGCFTALEATSRVNLAYPTCSWLPVPFQISLSAQQISVAVARWA